jgi:glutaminase
MTDETCDRSLDLLLNRTRSAASPLRDVLRDLHARFRTIDEGAVAGYIPELAKANPDWFAISVVTVGGQAVDVGDHGQQFSIQSISKPFVFGLALERRGRDAVLARVGVEPTGEAFNAIVLDEASNRPFNPMVNAGAIATADLIDGKDYPERVGQMIGMFGRYCGRPVYVDNAVFISERATGHRNRAIAHLMLNFGMVSDRVEETLELYFQQCAVLVSCHDLAVMAATLANSGVNPITGERAVDTAYVKDLLSVMYTCGMYDYAGSWAHQVGIPAKSGVSGGLLAVVPGQFGVGVFSPRVDARGNSVRGIKVCEELSRAFGLHVFESGFTGVSLSDQIDRRRRNL